MKYFTTIAALISLVPGILALTINTPMSVVQCQPQLLSWTDGVAPYYITIIPGGQPAAAPLKTFDTQSGNSLTWVVDITGGTSITVSCKDSTGATAYTDMVTIQPNSDSSCIGAGGSSSNNGNAGNAAPGITTKAADAASTGSSSPPAATGSVGKASSAGGNVITRSTTIGGSQPTQSAARPASSSPASPATTNNAAAGSSSGTKSKYSVGGYFVAGAMGLLGAAFL